jgi:three-Cys-motif partner protein
VPTGDLVLSSDGKLAMTVGPWAKEKLHYIRRYCYIFNTGMKGKWGTRTYIDLFSGPGKCIIETTGEEIDGSPLIALKCDVPFSHYFFNDINANSMASLQNRAGSFASVNINYFNSDCNDAIDQLLPKLPPFSLDFCFIDPTNWQIKFDSIRRLTKDRRMDLALTFHTGEMKRVADSAPEELDDLFDGPGWQEEYKSMLLKGRRKGSRLLLDFYRQKLRELGYQEFDDHVLVRTTTGLPFYHLVFASKDHRGRDFWNKISQKSSTGQLRFALPEV